MYVSRWQSPEVAERFAKFYVAAVAKRYRNATVAADWTPAGGKFGNPIASAQITTEEGPVIVEQWPGNTVFVTESFDAPTSARLRDAVLAAAPHTHASAARTDLTLRLAAWPELGSLRDAAHDSAMRSVMQFAREVAGR